MKENEKEMKQKKKDAPFTEASFDLEEQEGYSSRKTWERKL